MPAVLALPAFWGAVGAGAAGTAAIIGAHETASGAQNAAQIQADAAKHASDAQAKAAADTLAFQRQQAEAQYQNDERTRKANYDQWVASRGGAQSIRSILGLPALDIPAYVPSQDPGFTSGAPTATSNSAPTTPGAPASASSSSPGGPASGPTDPVTAGLMKVYQSLGVQPTGRGTGATDIAYYTDQVNATGGWTPSNAGYWQNRIASDLAKQKGGASGTSSPSSVASYLAPKTNAPVTALLNPTNPYLPATDPSLAVNG